jgi:hypothetical protein
MCAEWLREEGPRSKEYTQQAELAETLTFKLRGTTIIQVHEAF